ncbi:hypothetical protein Scep_022966 [Stephania cephalantha]|uniref:poly(ADP-ribose) glycohydrolase n=1 Tax=Stephania cephalantha TaxID=152367 RepID=A0AAP0I1B3_9MAGN
METREDLKSILHLLPLALQSSSSHSSLLWPPQVLETLKILSNGPDQSKVDSGSVLFLAISDLRHSLGLSSAKDSLAFSAEEGFALFFDELMSRVDAVEWFGEVVPALARLLLKLPSLMEEHYREAESVGLGVSRGGTGLRVLRSQEAGIVFLRQELIGALLACSLFCLFPTSNRGGNFLPAINFDCLFAALCPSYCQKQENKIICLIHYFKRITTHMPMGFVSFERKVLPLDNSSPCVSYPQIDWWSKSIAPLCNFEVSHSGLIEDQKVEAVEVDFANKYLGGGALSRGCVQEEIRFMINPEVIVGMLFLPRMADNEAIEIVGAERFSNYTGYASTFRFSGNHQDERPVDCVGRRKTWITAIDALCHPGKRQFGVECILRETNKAFCGFLDHSIDELSQIIAQDAQIDKYHFDQVIGVNNEGRNYLLLPESSSAADGPNERVTEAEPKRNSTLEWSFQGLGPKGNVGIATGNWGCGAFGGDPQLKAVIQWLAASQALRPFILYYSFGEEALQGLEQATRWISSHEWTVGELWDMLMHYSSQVLEGDTHGGFFNWLLPSLAMQSLDVNDVQKMDVDEL